MDNFAADAPGRGREAGLTRADGTPVRVLVVDDEPSLAELLSSVLRYEGWTVRTAGTGADAVRTAREFRPDAVVLDIMLPDFNGLEVMRRMRAEIPQVCVLFLTARDAVEDRVAGITAGGDDYVTKPFSLEEVLARLRGLLRRAHLTRVHTEGSLAVGDLTMDEDPVLPGRHHNAVNHPPVLAAMIDIEEAFAVLEKHPDRLMGVNRLAGMERIREAYVHLNLGIGGDLGRNQPEATPLRGLPAGSDFPAVRHALGKVRDAQSKLKAVALNMNGQPGRRSSSSTWLSTSWISP